MSASGGSPVITLIDDAIQACELRHTPAVSFCCGLNHLAGPFGRREADPACGGGIHRPSGAAKV